MQQCLRVYDSSCCSVASSEIDARDIPWQESLECLSISYLLAGIEVIEGAEDNIDYILETIGNETRETGEEREIELPGTRSASSLLYARSCTEFI